MALPTRSLLRLTKRPSKLTSTRTYTTSPPANSPPWFPALRTALLSRPGMLQHERISPLPSEKLTTALSSFLPPSWNLPPTPTHPFLPAGHHLIWFNANIASHELLSDGTDALHSPPAPFVRRMWAGGEVRVAPGYFSQQAGFTMGTVVSCVERIKDVRVSGQGAASRVFVAIERRFARAGIEEEEESMSESTVFRSQAELQEEMQKGETLMTEDRNLVFFTERTEEELRDIQAGKMAEVRYLPPPSNPDFAHALTPTRTLLFRYSALTYNAHLIHLDPGYAKNVEGHRNLLVHGPLSLTLMLQAMSGYVAEHNAQKMVVQSIEYRNLAPLYCDEEMRICGKEKKRTDEGSVYDIWIEGPTGGVAVKGTVRTVKLDNFVG